MNNEYKILSDDAKRIKAWDDHFNLSFTWNGFCKIIIFVVSQVPIVKGYFSEVG